MEAIRVRCATPLSLARLKDVLRLRDRRHGGLPRCALSLASECAAATELAAVYCPSIPAAPRCPSIPGLGVCRRRLHPSPPPRPLSPQAPIPTPSSPAAHNLHQRRRALHPCYGRRARPPSPPSTTSIPAGPATGALHQHRSRPPSPPRTTSINAAAPSVPTAVDLHPRSRRPPSTQVAPTPAEDTGPPALPARGTPVALDARHARPVRCRVRNPPTTQTHYTTPSAACIHLPGKCLTSLRRSCTHHRLKSSLPCAVGHFNDQPEKVRITRMPALTPTSAPVS